MHSNLLASKDHGLAVMTPPSLTSGLVRRNVQGYEMARRFGFGVESHNDLVDGLATLIEGLVQQGLQLPKIHWIHA